METSSRIQSIYDESSSDDEFDVVAAAGSCPTQNKSFWVLAKQLLASHNPSPVLARRWARSRTQLEKMTAIVSMLYEKRLRNFAISNQSYSDFVQLCTYEWGKLVRSLRKLTLDDRQIYQILGEKGFDVKYGAIENRLLKRFTRLEHWCGIHFSDMRIDDQLSRLEEKLSGKWKDDHFFSHLNPPLVAIFGLDHLIIQTFGRMKETMAFFPSENQGNTMYAFYVRRFRRFRRFRAAHFPFSALLVLFQVVGKNWFTLVMNHQNRPFLTCDFANVPFTVVPLDVDASLARPV